MQSEAKPAIKHKSFAFETSLRWNGGKTGIILGTEKPEIRFASPPEFKGEAGVWTPEDLFVGSIDMCMLLTFSAFAERKSLPVKSYTSRARGILEFVDGSYRFTKVFISPTIIVETPEAVNLARQTMERAHQQCLITNSITAEIVLETVINTPESVAD